MKLPITDKFLFDVYNFTEGIGEIFDLCGPRTMKEVCYSDLYRLKKKYTRERTKKQFSQLVYHLKSKGYIKIKNLEQKQGIILTPKGAEKVLRIKFKMMDKKSRKDGKWQMIIFDIPESKRHLRKLLRENLYLLGYKMLQQSVWMCPYNVLKETEGVLRKYLLDRYVKLFLIEEIEV